MSPAIRRVPVPLAALGAPLTLAALLTSVPAIGAVSAARHMAVQDGLARLVAEPGRGEARLSGRGVRIGFAESPSVRAVRGRAVRPARPMLTVTVHGINAAGQPDTGDYVALENVNDPAPLSELGATLIKFHDGTATFRVRAGTYWAVGIFSRVSIVGLGHPGPAPSAAGSKATRLVVIPQFTVSANRAVTLDARAATSRLTITTPRPAVSASPVVAFERVSPDGKRLTVFALPLPVNAPVYVRPTSRIPTDGTLYSFTADQLVSPAAATATYQYYVAMRGPRGLIPAQHFRISAASLATVHENLFSAAPGTGTFWAFGGYAAEDGSDALSPRLAVPGQTTIYLSAGRSINWQGYYTQDLPISGGQYEQPASYRPGQVITRDWNAYPLHPAPNVRLPGPPLNQEPTLISADRSANTLTLDFMPFTDSVPGHLGTGYLPVRGGTVGGTYQIQQNGTTIAAGNALHSKGIISGEFYRQVKLAARPSVVTFTLTATRTGSAYPLSTATSTTWTWHSAPEAGGAVPTAWFCSDAQNRDCRAEPLLTLAYAVSSLALNGTALPGTQRLTVRVGHLQLAAAPKITKVSVQVSANDGMTWTPATVTGSGRTYQARFTGHSGSLVTLRVTATDAAGGQITETITRAYAIAS